MLVLSLLFAIIITKTITTTKTTSLCHFTVNPTTASAKIHAAAIAQERKLISNLHHVYGM